MTGAWAVLSAAAVLSAQAPAAAGPSFCARLAPQLGMRPVNPRIVDGVRTQDQWRTNLLKGVGAALFGGTVMASFSVRPVDENDAAEYRRLDHMCDHAPRGALCGIDGPARLTVGTKGGKVSADLAPGERAYVEMSGTAITCRDERSR